jgi:haloalkane dehalogenase
VLAAYELRGVAFDLPGLGLAARPSAFDYTWTGFGEWCAAAVDTLALERFHLVVHDFGGPVGFELCALMPQRIRSSAGGSARHSMTVLRIVTRRQASSRQ